MTNKSVMTFISVNKISVCLSVYKFFFYFYIRHGYFVKSEHFYSSRGS